MLIGAHLQSDAVSKLGFQADTMGSTPRVWFDVSVAADHTIAIQPEGGGTLPSMNWQSLSTNHCEKCNPPRTNSSSGGQYIQSIDRYKWLEPRCGKLRHH